MSGLDAKMKNKGRVRKKYEKSKNKARSNSNNFKYNSEEEGFDDEELKGLNIMSTTILSEMLSLNRAAHVLTRNEAILDKLINEMSRDEACELLMRDYELESVLVLVIKRNDNDKESESEHESIERGLKKVKSETIANESENEKEKENSKDSKSSSNSDNNLLDKPNKKTQNIIDLTVDESHDPHDPNGTSSGDSMRVALYCKDLGKMARVGRVVRVLESIANENEKYVVELVK